MSALPAPATPPQLVEAPSVRRQARSFRVLDRMRLKRWNELRMDGRDPIDAWELVATDPDIGLHSLRGETRPKRRSVALSFVRFVDRVNPHALEEAQRYAHTAAAGVAAEMVDVIVGISRGRHGGRQDEAEAQEREITAQTAPVAAVQLNAAKTMLQIAGVLRQGPGPGSSPTHAVQVNVGPSAHEVAAALRTNPEAHQRAIDAARMVSGVGPETPAAPPPAASGDG